MLLRSRSTLQGGGAGRGARPLSPRLLSRVRVQGHDGARSEWLRPLDLGYTTFEQRARLYQSIAAMGNQVPDRLLGNS